MQENVELLTMPKRKTLSDLYNESLTIDALCDDYTIEGVNSNVMRMLGTEGNKLIYIPDNPSDIDTRCVDMSKFAFSQLCAKLGVPVSYMNKCFDTGRTNLVADNINAWIDGFNKNLLIREYDNRIRGVLSDKYSILDTPTLLSALGDTIDESEYNVKAYFMNEERFHLRLTQKEVMPNIDEDLFAGIQIDSSDVGRSMLVVKFMIYKQICTNGLCVSRGNGVLFEQKHIGITQEEFVADLNSAIKNIPLLVEAITENIRQARIEGMSEYAVHRFSESQMQEFIAQVKSQTELSDEGVGKVIELMQDHYAPTKWGYINAITEVAQDYSLERRLTLEKIAGNLLIA